jgi:hypothetical protein
MNFVIAHSLDKYLSFRWMIIIYYVSPDSQGHLFELDLVAYFDRHIVLPFNSLLIHLDLFYYCLVISLA